ncbi:MAG: hypothetical protein P8179_08840 [Candidatus Thiodiazotropha sp.]|jgi:hypothetical protein
MISGTLKQYYIAVARLENPEEYEGLPDLESKHRRIRIWRYPSFETISSWTVFGLGKELVLRRLEWDRFTEFPSQTELHELYACEAKIDEAQFESIMSDLSKIEFRPLIEDQAIMCDGTEYGIEVGHGAYSRNISWHSGPPDGWEKLSEWHEQTIIKLDRNLPESTCRAREKNS